MNRVVYLAAMMGLVVKGMRADTARAESRTSARGAVMANRHGTAKVVTETSVNED